MPAQPEPKPAKPTEPPPKPARTTRKANRPRHDPPAPRRPHDRGCGRGRAHERRGRDGDRPTPAPARSRDQPPPHRTRPAATRKTAPTGRVQLRAETPSPKRPHKLIPGFHSKTPPPPCQRNSPPPEYALKFPLLPADTYIIRPRQGGRSPRPRDTEVVSTGPPGSSQTRRRVSKTEAGRPSNAPLQRS